MTAVIALYNYNKNNKEDLAFVKNEHLVVLKKLNDGQWALARNLNGVAGVIPLNFVEPKCEPRWLHGNISRVQTEAILRDYPIGSFLVRSSGRFTGDYTLSLVSYEKCDTQSPVQHYHIHTIHRTLAGSTETYFSLDKEELFPSLRKLIEHYKENTDGLATSLVSAVPNIRRQHLCFLKQQRLWIQSNQLTLGLKLGHGEFGEVRKGRYQNRDVAVKRYKSSAKYQLVYEACIMMMLRHENLVSLIGVTEENDMFYLISEFLSNGSLLCFLRSRGRALIGSSTLLSFAIDTAKGLVYMEEHGFLHCDIAARNVLLSDASPTPVAKLADFGLSRRANSLAIEEADNDADSIPLNSPPIPAFENNECGGAVDRDTIPMLISTPMSIDLIDRIPIKWTAPESIRSRAFSHKSDVWSFGVMLWELFSYGRLPYPRLMTNQVLQYLEAGERLEAPEDCPPAVFSLMTEQWSAVPHQRPTFSQCLFRLRAVHLDVTTSSLNRHSSQPLRSSFDRDISSGIGRKSVISAVSDDVYESISDESTSENIRR